MKKNKLSKDQKTLILKNASDFLENANALLSKHEMHDFTIAGISIAPNAVTNSLRCCDPGEPPFQMDSQGNIIRVCQICR